MRHRKQDKKLNRFSSLRKATMRDIAKSVIRHESIKTTLAKAKEARKLVDRLVSFGKQNDLHSKRLAFKELCDHDLVNLLFNEVAPRFSNINGGYTRIMQLAKRRGDNAQVVILELTVQKAVDKTKKKIGPQEKAKTEVRSEDKVIKDKPEVVSEPRHKPKAEEKPRPKDEEKPKVKKEETPKEKAMPKVEKRPRKTDKKPPEKFFKGIRKFFRRERDFS